MKKILKYKNALILFSVVLITILAFYMQSLYKSLIKFEANDIDNYITTIINNLKEKEYLIACFDKGITSDTVTIIAKKQPYYVVFRDSGMASDSVATNFDQIFETYSPQTIRKVL